MKVYPKRTGLFYLCNTLALFAGMLISIIPTIVSRAIFHLDAPTLDSSLLSGVIDLLCSMSVLCFLMLRDTYEKPQFSLQAEASPPSWSSLFVGFCGQSPKIKQPFVLSVARSTSLAFCSPTFPSVF